ncbi:hypothetical protein H9Y05_01120 [Crocinitomicaceae bacterium CZZ-1]|uniref:YtxH domain-containing protein n=1 Tax=Taishania pollutisoli TaxID=2766479 RepID=A0A8J6U1G1_9FLAO|nr:DUF6132 family protein [Taishania pollutisoli]MBC9811065.1 hypothetical protein [Taishania pollutisoli]MBX2950221.1 hypothetical protein [Crocinitomicaceae bacterium]NGF76702.1 hypothetical protein [Fluviicola sp. SGL-29]
MKNFIKRQRLLLIGIAIGVVAGYAYWKFVGCNSGTCPITSNPLNSILYGAVTGGLFFSLFQKKKPYNSNK